MPSRYQSDQVDRPNGPLRRCANRRLAQYRCRSPTTWSSATIISLSARLSGPWPAKNHGWIRVKVAKSFSRIAFAMVAGRQLFPHPCCQPHHYILDKLLAFHREHDTPMAQVLVDLQAATDQLPRSAFAREAEPLAKRLERIQATKRSPQLLGDILPIVLARLGIDAVQSSSVRDQDPS